MQALKDEVESLRNERALLRNDLREAAETVSIFLFIMFNPEFHAFASVMTTKNGYIYCMNLLNA